MAIPTVRSSAAEARTNTYGGGVSGDSEPANTPEGGTYRSTDPSDAKAPTSPPSGMSGSDFVFPANTNRDSVAVNYFDGTFGGSMSHARYVRLEPQSWHHHPSMRVAVLVREGAAQVAVAQRLGGVSLSNHDGSEAYMVVAGSSAASVRQVEAKVAVFGKVCSNWLTAPTLLLLCSFLFQAYHFGLDKIRE